jgi:hypothetical protein
MSCNLKVRGPYPLRRFCARGGRRLRGELLGVHNHVGSDGEREPDRKPPVHTHRLRAGFGASFQLKQLHTTHTDGSCARSKKPAKATAPFSRAKAQQPPSPKEERAAFNGNSRAARRSRADGTARKTDEGADYYLPLSEVRTREIAFLRDAGDLATGHQAAARIKH